MYVGGYTDILHDIIMTNDSCVNMEWNFQDFESY
jgi:hypothetical protein